MTSQFALAYLRTTFVWPTVRAEVREFTPDTLVYMAEIAGFVVTPIEALEWFEEKSV